MMKSSKATDSVLVRKSWQVQTKFLRGPGLHRGKAEIVSFDRGRRLHLLRDDQGRDAEEENAGKETSKSRRLRTDPTIAAASHPTRQTILKNLQQNDALTTIELQKLTGEDRYNLYHHLAKLREAGLVDYELEGSRAKKYFLNSDEDTSERLLYIEGNDPNTDQALAGVLKVLAGSSDSTLPVSEDVESVIVIFRLRKRL